MAAEMSRIEDLERELARRSTVMGKMAVWLAVTGLALAFIVLSTFERGYIVVGHAIDGCIRQEVYAVHSSWWGLKKQRTEIKWTTPTYDRQQGIDFQDWCYEASPGEWVGYFFFMD